MKSITASFLLLLSIIIVSCSTTNNTPLYREEAKALCNVFTEDAWNDMGKDLEAWELQKAIHERINESVKSKKMTGLLQSITSVKPEDRYSYYIQEVNKLTKMQNDCPGLKDYFG